MNKTIEQLLEGEYSDHIFPFFWQHGEEEAVLREYMKVIHESNIKSVCIESRPHPDFCGDKWWQDMDIILDEARKRGMKVWILDDSHFPTGYANGAALSAPLEHRRQNIYCKIFEAEKKEIKTSVNKIVASIPNTYMGRVMNVYNQNHKYHFDDDTVLSVSALFEGEAMPKEIPFSVDGDKLSIPVPKGVQKVYVLVLSRNTGIHRSYINMLSSDACKILLDAVYEPHYMHYKEDFGTTIAGFFSDEPELGNGRFFDNNITVGVDIDLPWSKELEERIEEAWQRDYRVLLPVLWDNDFPDEVKARIRYSYMDIVTSLVQHAFSVQIGTWCEEHGVRYIGHMIEDSNNHARLGCSLGHYYRGLYGQHMSGIDCIGGQVIPGKEDTGAKGLGFLYKGRDGEFFHFLLGKLASSSAQIDPIKQGNAMCEIFGNYGWSEGVRLEKYLCDHMLVRGVNNFVPHAFSPKKYPDLDCPPHFYAHGHNPQYRAFGALMGYTNRITSLISGGKAYVDVAVLYHGDFEWAGNYMLSQKVSRFLTEHQVDYHILPVDVFADRNRYQTKLEGNLTVNGYSYRTLIIPYAQFIPQVFLDAILELSNGSTQIWFVDALPQGIAEGGSLPEQIQKCSVGSLVQIGQSIYSAHKLSPENDKMRIYHYCAKEEIYFLFNEGNDVYSGELFLSKAEAVYEYDAFENMTYELDSRNSENGVKIAISLYPHESRLIVVGKSEVVHKRPQINETKTKVMLENWQKGRCKSIQYPNFGKWEKVRKFMDEGRAHPFFSGIYAYKSQFAVSDSTKKYILRLEDVGETVEVFVNEQSLGIKVGKPFLYDISEYIQDGVNFLRLEVATTLERERKVNLGKQAPVGLMGEPCVYCLDSK